jgi:hypothetical protein
MSYRDWHVGMKVVCIDPTWGASGPLQAEYCPNLPVKGQVYTIRTLECRVVVKREGFAVLIRLEEIHNPINYQGEPVFFGKKFRPVQPRKTDISIFTAMLTGSKQKEPA